MMAVTLQHLQGKNACTGPPVLATMLAVPAGSSMCNTSPGQYQCKVSF